VGDDDALAERISSAAAAAAKIVANLAAAMGADVWPSVCGQRRRTNTFSPPPFNIGPALPGASEPAFAAGEEEVLRYQGRLRSIEHNSDRVKIG
jgi:hypothetical protein